MGLSHYLTTIDMDDNFIDSESTDRIPLYETQDNNALIW